MSSEFLIRRGGGTSVAGFSSLSGRAGGNDFKRHFTGAKRRNTLARRTCRLRAHAGVDLVEGRDAIFSIHSGKLAFYFFHEDELWERRR